MILQRNLVPSMPLHDVQLQVPSSKQSTFGMAIKRFQVLLSHGFTKVTMLIFTDMRDVGVILRDVLAGLVELGIGSHGRMRYRDLG